MTRARGGKGQPGSARCAAASCENRLMMQPAAELHRVLVGTSTRHMPHCCGALGPPSRPFPPVPYPFSLGIATRRAPFEARENKCTPGRAAI